MRGRRPAVRGTAPRIVFVWGGPGSGKTTVARLFARQRWPDCDFVDLDLDDAIHFHPAGSRLFEVRDALTGLPLHGVGNAHAMNHCIQQVTGEYLDAIHAVFKARRHHQIMHHASPDLMAEAAHMGYRTALLYVSVPFELAERRARQRAAITGRFIDRDTFRRFFRMHQQLAPHYAGMCDAAYAVNNTGDEAAANAAGARSLPEGRARAAALRSLVREWGHALPDDDGWTTTTGGDDPARNAAPRRRAPRGDTRTGPASTQTRRGPGAAVRRTAAAAPHRWRSRRRAARP